MDTHSPHLPHPAASTEPGTRRDTAPPAMQRALGIMRDEHAAIRTVLDRIDTEIQAAIASMSAWDCTSVKLMLAYIREFPEALHHPKEEEYLFSKLGQRTDAFATTIAALEDQHVTGERMLSELEAALQRFESGSPPAFAQFRHTFAEYKDAQLQHMLLEESVIVPAARHHLSDDDWEVLAQAFGSNQRGRFDASVEKSCRNLYAKIARLED